MRGSLFKRCSHPKSAWTRCAHAWTLVVPLGIDPETGRRRQRWETVHGTKEDAKRRLAELVSERYSGALHPAPSITVGEYLEERWLPYVGERPI